MTGQPDPAECVRLVGGVISCAVSDASSIDLPCRRCAECGGLHRVQCGLRWDCYCGLMPASCINVGMLM
jgi:hypothetical protein